MIHLLALPAAHNTTITIVISTPEQLLLLHTRLDNALELAEWTFLQAL